MLNNLAEVLKGNEAEGEPATLRRLQCNDECRSALHAALATFIHATLHDQYPGANHGEPDPAYFIRGLLHMPKKYPNTYFCSKLVAATLHAKGVLDRSMADNAWTLGDRHDALLRQHLKPYLSLAKL